MSAEPTIDHAIQLLTDPATIAGSASGPMIDIGSQVVRRLQGLGVDEVGARTLLTAAAERLGGGSWLEQRPSGGLRAGATSQRYTEVFHVWVPRAAVVDHLG